MRTPTAVYGTAEPKAKGRWTMGVAGRAIAILCVFGVAASALAADRGLRGRKYVEDEVIVKLKPGVILENVRALAGETVPGAFVVKSIALPARAGVGQLALLRTPRGKAKVDELVARFSSLPDVEYVEPNFIASIPGEKAAAAKVEPWPARTFGPPGSTTSGREISGEDLVAMGVYPSDSYSQWGFVSVDADVIWAATAASPLVAVIDSGVDYTHPDLVGKVVKGYNFVESTADPMDDNGHGTHVAGVIAARANNKVGIPGISNGNVLAIKTLDFSGYGTYFEIAQAIYYAANNAAVKVINMSLGGPDALTLSDAVGYAVVMKGKLLVAAAGNDNVDVPLYPAGYSVAPAFLNRVLAVAASGVYVTGSTDGQSYWFPYCKAPYSNYGTWVNIAAPGTDIVSTMPTKPNWNGIYNYGTMSGTSMAAPHVAAIAARVWSVNSLFTNVQIAERLTGGGAFPQPRYMAPYGSYDVDDDFTLDLANCWDPTWASQGGAAGRTLPSLTQADVAMGMQRGEISGWTYDATNGNALPSGTILQVYQGPALKGQVTMADLGQMYWTVSNLPWSTTPYSLKASKTGYTSGAQPYGIAYLWPGWVKGGYYSDLAIPKLSANRTFVTSWYTNGDDDVDQHLLLPPDKPFDVGTDFGLDKTRLTASGDYGTGTLVAYPFARYMADSYYTLRGRHEATAVKALYPTTAGPYRLFNRDYSSGRDLTFATHFPHVLEGYSPVVATRLWQSGVIKATVSADSAAIQTTPACTFDGGAAVCDKWLVGTLNSAGVFTPVNTVGDGVNGAVVPYGGANLKAGIAAAPKP
jgi:subtilisin family serine protease